MHADIGRQSVTREVPSLIAKANGIGLDGVAELTNSADVETFIGLASQGKVWTRKI